ncbi:MAG: hypothetical protein HY813_01925 [Candidatus Portnoybacteria bacterium]|nr:hypothetical protein [Candidatus Portnoybacteria bacterium]
MVTKPYFVILNEVKNLLRMQEIKLLFSNKLRDSSGFTLRMTVLKPSLIEFLTQKYAIAKFLILRNLWLIAYFCVRSKIAKGKSRITKDSTTDNFEGSAFL